MSGTEAPKRTKPSDVAMAEHRAWRQGWKAATILAETCLNVRFDLMEQGFPSGHVLCEDIDQDAAKWARYAEQMRRDLFAHAKLNQIELED